MLFFRSTPNESAAHLTMKTFKAPIAACLLIAGFVCLPHARADLDFTITPTYDPTLFGGQGGWTSGDTLFSLGATDYSAGLQLDLLLTQDVTLTDLGSGYNYGFGMGGLDPEIPTNGDAFTFSIELLENGNLITPSFAYDLANPYTFGFDEINPFSNEVDNLGVTTGTGALAPTLTFNEIDILISSSVSGQEATDFSVELGVTSPPATPDGGPTWVLLASVIGLVACARRHLAAVVMAKA
jgi:hypothetical protein